MHFKPSVLCVSGLLALALSASAIAQQTNAPVAPANDDIGNYSLKGGALPTGAATGAAAVGSTSYELSASGIGGRGGDDLSILTAQTPDRGAPIRTESGMFIYPAVFSGFGNNDNLLGTSTDIKSASFFQLSPSLVAEMKHRGDRYTAQVNIDSMRYSGSSGDNYNNYQALIAGDHYFSARSRMGWQIGQISTADPRGSNDRPILSEPDRWHAPLMQGRFIYGAKEAAGRIEADVNYQAKKYVNHRDFTAVADLDTTGVAGRFFYRVGSRSLVLVEARNTDFNYVSSLAKDSNTERRFYVGYTWEATAATTGIVKVGRMTKDFEQAGRAGFSGGSWDATLRWLPQTYSSIDFVSSRSTADPTGVGNYLLNTDHSLTWSHKWTKSLTSRVSGGLTKSDYAGTTRTDDISRTSLTVDYDVLRWVSMGIDLAHTNNKSTDVASEFKRNVIMFTLNATL
jgi:hypothetical protein